MPTKKKAAKSSPYTVAVRSLSRRDPRLRPLFRRVGPCTLQPHTDPFPVLVRTIISQQLSSRAAKTIGDRLVALLTGGLTVAGIGSLSDEQVRGCGISGGKLKSIRDLCARIVGGTLDPDRFHSLG